MNLSRWLSAVFQPQAPTSSHLQLLNESQPLQDLPSSNPVELIRTRLIGVDGLNSQFQEAILKLGGKENILLVGEAGYSSENDGFSSEILQELSLALFQSPEYHHLQRKNDEESLEASTKALSCVTSKCPSKSRMLEFPVVLAVFRETRITDSANVTLMKEILRDVEERTRGSGSKMVGIIYTRGPLEEQKNLESKKHLLKLMSQVFKGVESGVCCYSSYQPKSILEVKRTILETLEGAIRDQSEHTKGQAAVMERSFRDLVHQLGGRERFLLLGNVCPSVRPSEKAGIFKEITKALFDDVEIAREKHSPETEEVTPNLKRDIKPTSCTQLPQPKSFPYPLILVAFRSSFLKEEDNRPQVKEILTDVKTRVTVTSTHVIGVVCSHEPLEGAEEQELHDLLQKILCQTFRCPTGVCSFVRNNLDSVEGVKRCVCHVLALRN